jgi:hypothetical protein
MATILFGAEQPLKCSVLISKHCDADALLRLPIAQQLHLSILYCVWRNAVPRG